MPNMKNFLHAAIAASFLLTSCASSSQKISAAYVSPLQYQSYNCNQIQLELQRVGRRVSEISGIQDAKATKDAVALGVGLILFWPSLFFMIGSDKKEELGRLKGEYELNTLNTLKAQVLALQKEVQLLKGQHGIR